MGRATLFLKPWSDASGWMVIFFVGTALSHKTCGVVDHTCANGGTCVQTINGAYCSCPQPFTGPYCSELDPCSGAPCGDHGTCVSEGRGRYSCHCQPEYLGLNCELAADREEHSVQQCHDRDEDSFCLCEVNGRRVRAPILTPDTSRHGVGTRDILLGLSGLLIGWVVGSGIMALYRNCCQDSGDDRDGAYVRSDWRNRGRSRTASAMSSVNQYSDFHQNWLDSSETSNPLAIYGDVTSRDFRTGPVNVYRAGFADTLSYQTAPRSSAQTYTSGHKDWESSLD